MTTNISPQQRHTSPHQEAATQHVDQVLVTCGATQPAGHSRSAWLFLMTKQLKEPYRASSTSYYTSLQSLILCQPAHTNCPQWRLNYASTRPTIRLHCCLPLQGICISRFQECAALHTLGTTLTPRKVTVFQSPSNQFQQIQGVHHVHQQMRPTTRTQPSAMTLFETRLPHIPARNCRSAATTNTFIFYFFPSPLFVKTAGVCWSFVQTIDKTH